MQKARVEIDKRFPEAMGCDLEFPSKWDELTVKQFLYIAGSWQRWKLRAHNTEAMREERIDLMFELCGLENKKDLRKLKHLLSFLDERNDVNLLDCVDFIFKDNNLTKNLLPKLKVDAWNWYYGPGDRLNDISIDEFSFAYSCYINYLRTGTEKELNTFVAVLYRPFNKDFLKTGEARVPFNNKLVDVYEKKLAAVPVKFKMAVFLFFAGCMEHLARKYPKIFMRAEGNERSGAGSFIDTVRNMSGGVFGTFDETKNVNLVIFLKELDSHMNKTKSQKS